MKILTPLICFLFLAFSPNVSFAANYNIEDRNGGYVAEWNAERELNYNIKLGKVELAFIPSRDIGYLCFSIKRSDVGPYNTWVRSYAKSIIKSDNYLSSQRVAIFFSNGESIATENTAMAMSTNDIEGFKQNPDSYLYDQFFLFVFADGSSFSGEKVISSSDISRFFTLLRSYDITTMRIGGNVLDFSDLNTSYHFNAMLEEIAKKGGYTANMGKNELQGGSSNSGVSSNTGNGSDVEFEKVTVDFDKYQDGQLGMIIKATFVTRGLKNVKCNLLAYFYYGDGTPLKDKNQRFHTPSGNVAADTFFTPSYDNSQYTDCEIFIPYEELHVPQISGKEHKIKFFLMLYDTQAKEFVGDGKKSEEFGFNITY